MGLFSKPERNVGRERVSDTPPPAKVPPPPPPTGSDGGQREVRKPGLPRKPMPRPANPEPLIPGPPPRGREDTSNELPELMDGIPDDPFPDTPRQREDLIELRDKCIEHLPDETTAWYTGYACALTNVIAEIERTLGNTASADYWLKQTERY